MPFSLRPHSHNRSAIRCLQSPATWRNCCNPGRDGSGHTKAMVPRVVAPGGVAVRMESVDSFGINCIILTDIFQYHFQLTTVVSNIHDYIEVRHFDKRIAVATSLCGAFGTGRESRFF